MRVANDQEGDADPASEQRRLTDLWAGGASREAQGVVLGLGGVCAVARCEWA